jgi:CheY-like chemotaxis protein
VLQSNVPAIALTGYGMDEDVKRARDAGFTAHLVKHAPLEQLRALLDPIASAKGARQGASHPG